MGGNERACEREFVSQERRCKETRAKDNFSSVAYVAFQWDSAARSPRIQAKVSSQGRRRSDERMRCSPWFTSRLDVFPLSSFTTRLLEVFVQIPAVTLLSATRMQKISFACWSCDILMDQRRLVT